MTLVDEARELTESSCAFFGKGTGTAPLAPPVRVGRRMDGTQRSSGVPAAIVRVTGDCRPAPPYWVGRRSTQCC